MALIGEVMFIDERRDVLVETSLSASSSSNCPTISVTLRRRRCLCEPSEGAESPVTSGESGAMSGELGMDGRPSASATPVRGKAEGAVTERNEF